MAEKKEEDYIKKLEKDFRAFQVEWKKFLKNDLPHLTAAVGSLTAAVGSIRKDVSTSIGHIAALVKDQKAMDKSLKVIDDNTMEILKRMK